MGWGMKEDKEEESSEKRGDTRDEGIMSIAKCLKGAGKAKSKKMGKSTCVDAEKEWRPHEKKEHGQRARK